MSADSNHDFDLKDIRAGLRERITLFEEMMSDEQAEFAAEQEKLVTAHKQKIDNYKVTIANYKRMLEIEEGFAKHIEAKAKVGPKQPNTAGTEAKMLIPQALVPLGDFFCAELAQRGNMTKEGLRQLAFDAGYFPTSEGGRATHATLVNLIRAQRVVAVKDGFYAAPEREKELL